jgi:metacaspase-1
MPRKKENQTVSNPKGISLHIGLNKVNNESYGVTIPELFGCENDALALEKVAKTKGYETNLLLSNAATYQNVVAKIKAIAKKLVSGDIFWLTYSGHGTQIPDYGNDEKDKKDEAWVVSDKLLLDDELNNLYALFAEGVRILVVSDSCHSGTVSREVVNNKSKKKVEVLPRFVSTELLTPYLEDKKNKSTLKRKIKSLATNISIVKASGILLSACKDNEVAFEFGNNGAYTKAFLDLIDSAKLTPKNMQLKIAEIIKNQTPQYSTFGYSNRGFVKNTVAKI